MAEFPGLLRISGSYLLCSLLLFKSRPPDGRSICLALDTTLHVSMEKEHSFFARLADASPVRHCVA